VLALLHLVDLVLQMAVGEQQVLATVEVVVEEQQPEGERDARGRAEPLQHRLVDEGRAAVGGDEQRGHLVGEVADGDAEVRVVAEAGDIDAHGRGGLAVAIVGDAVEDRGLLEAAVSAGCGTGSCAPCR
jgi:hypothetical protein